MLKNIAELKLWNNIAEAATEILHESDDKGGAFSEKLCDNMSNNKQYAEYDYNDESNLCGCRENG